MFSPIQIGELHKIVDGFYAEIRKLDGKVINAGTERGGDLSEQRTDQC